MAERAPDREQTRGKDQTGKADEVFVAGPAGRAPTRTEAEAMAAALFDAINAKRKAT